MLTVLRNREPELLKLSDEITAFDADLAAFSQELEATMVAYRGIGIAAPQVGVNKRMIIVRVGTRNVVMCNPKMVSGYGIQARDEGCLSVPNRIVRKVRSKKVAATYQDLDGAKQSIMMFGLDAACFQHELDHLNGVLIG